MKKELLALLLLAFPALALGSGYTYVQSAVGGAGSTSYTWGPITVGAHDTIPIVVQSNTSQTVSCSTSQSDTVSAGPQAVGISGSGYIYVFYVLSAKGGSTSFTCTSSATIYDGKADDYSGLSSFINSVSNTQTGITTTNGVLSGNLSVTSAPAMLWAVTSDVTFNAVPVAGTSPISFTGRGSVNDLTTEDAPISSTGTDQATFSPGNSAPSSFLTVALAFSVASGVSCTNSGYEPAGGALAVPNGTSGSFLSCAGTIVTPNCSSVTYYQPSGGKCGVN